MIDNNIILAFGVILKTIWESYKGNLPTMTTVAIYNNIAKRIKDGEIINGDLQRSLCKSFIQGQIDICQKCLGEYKRETYPNIIEVAQLDHKKDKLEDQLKNLEKEEILTPPIEVLNDIELLIIGDTTDERLEKVKNKLIEKAIKDDEIPECYIKYVENQLFEKMRDNFINDIKHNKVIHNILNIQILAGYDLKLVYLFEKFGAKLDENFYQFGLKLDDQFEKFGAKLDEKFDRPKQMDEYFIKNLSGKVRRVENKLFIKASNEEIKRYYDGAEITWRIISSDAVIKRDILARLGKEWIYPISSINMICVVGAAGEGKSSVTWKFIYDLIQKQEFVILQVKNKLEPETLRQFETFYYDFQIPFIVLVDDIFRNDGVTMALEEISKSQIPMTILATSRINEFNEGRIPFNIKSLNLEPPNIEEKKHIIEEFERKGAQLAGIKKDLLEESVPFLVFMMEVTHGKLFDQIIKREIERLKVMDEIVYNAYQYICTYYQYEISIPKSILERLNKNFSRVDNDEYHPASRGIIIKDDVISGNLRTRHPLIAKKSTKYIKDDQITILANIFNVIDVENIIERKSVLHLLREMARTDYSDIYKILNYDIINEFIKRSTITEMGIWKLIFKTVKDEERFSLCTQIALNKYPITASDCIWMLRFYQERGEDHEALPKIQEWLKSNPSDNVVRVDFIRFITRFGTPIQIENIIKDTEIWLSKNPNDKLIRSAFLGFIKWKGTPKQKENIIKDTEIWLKDHPDDISTILEPYLVLIREKGNQDQVERTIEDTILWLKKNPEDIAIFEAYLVLIRERGNQDQVERTIENTILWLKKNPEDKKIRSITLSFFRERGFLKLENIQIVCEDVEEWMKRYGHHPLFIDYLTLVKKIRNTEIDANIDIELVKQLGYEFIKSCKWADNVRQIRDFAEWLGEEKFFDESREIYENLLKINMRNLEKSTVYFGCGKLFLGHAMSLEYSNPKRIDNFRKAEEKFKETLVFHKGHHVAHIFLAITLNEQGRKEDADNQLKHAEWWAKINEKDNFSPGRIPYKIGVFYIEFKFYKKAIYWLEVATEKEQENFANWWRLGYAHMRLALILEETKNFKESRVLLEKAIHELEMAYEKAPKPLQLPASINIPNQITECKDHLLNLNL